MQIVVVIVHALFLSTLSLRRATIISPHSTPDNGNFYPRSPCGERLVDTSKDAIKTVNFYPRSPCGERRQVKQTYRAKLVFLSTLSLRRATSIKPIFGKIDTNFYPRSPCGERLFANFEGFFWWVISIHALLAESDAVTNVARTPTTVISIHALLAESDEQSASYNEYLDISIHALLAESDNRPELAN